MGGDLSVELPFTLTHPKPEPPPPQSPIETPTTATTIPDSNKKNTKPQTNGSDQTVPVDLNLIEFDTNSINGNKATTNGDDDLIFEEFARIRLKGHDADDTDV
jgi:beta-arrestin